MLSRFSVKKPYTVLVAVIVIIILGFTAYDEMTVDLLPNLDLPYVAVMTSYTGATPETVETTVTKPLEDTLAITTNLKNITSISMENMSLVLLEFNQDTDVDSVTLEMRENLDLMSAMWDNDLIGTPMMMKLNPDMLPVMISTVSLADSNAVETSAFLNDNVMTALEGLEGVASVTTIGLVNESVAVTISDDKLAAINEKIADAIDGNLAEAQAAMDSAASQLSDAEITLKSQVATQQQTIDDAQAQISAGETQLNESAAQLTDAAAALNEQKETLTASQTELQTQRSALQEQITVLEQLGDNLTPEQQTQLTQLQAATAELDEQSSTLQASLDTVNSKLAETTSAQTEIEKQQTEINNQKSSLTAAQSELDKQAASAAAELDSAKSQLADQQAQLSSSSSSAKDEAMIDDMITTEMISGVLAAQNFSMPAGYVKDNDKQSTVKVGEAITSLKGLQKLVLFNIDLDGVGDITLGDVADTKITNDGADTYAKINGQDGVILSFQKQSTASTAEVCDTLNEKFADLEDKYSDAGLSFVPLMSQGDYINVVTDSVLKNLLMGAVLAVIILLLFLRNIRPTLIIALSIPASVLFAVVMMYFSGVTLNVMSLGGLALGVGMLVDNSIVVIENIYRLRSQGLPVKEAAIEGAQQVAAAIIASTLTTICVFVPIVFSDGLARQLFIDMGLTIAFSLIASLLVALSIVPALSSGLLRKTESHEGKFLLACKAKYKAALAWVLKHRALSLLFSLLLLIGSMAAAVSSGTSLLPQTDSTQMTATLSMKDNKATQQELWDMSDTVTEKILSIDDVKAIGAFQAGKESTYSFTSSSGNSMSFYILLNDNKSKSCAAISKEISALCADLDCQLDISENTVDMTALTESGISVNIFGYDSDTMQVIAADVEDVLRSTEGTTNVSDVTANSNTEYLISVDKTKAIKNGLTVAQVYQKIAADLSTDSKATSMRIDGKEYDVNVSASDEQTINADDLRKLIVSDEDSDEEITVSDIATVKNQYSPKAILRNNQQQVLTVSAEIADGYNVSKITDKVEKALADYETPAGYSLDIGGEADSIDDIMIDLLKAIGLAIVLIYLIMVAQFQSLLSPFIVLITLPLAFTGGFLALFISGFDVSVIAMLGVLVLSGIIVNNGIVLIDYVNRLRSSGLSIREALAEGGATRMRPILMTAMTTILGLSTLAMGFGTGAEIIQPMAIVAIGGLLYGTLMTLFIVPAIYDLFHRGKKEQLRQQRAEAVLSPGGPAIALDNIQPDAIAAPDNELIENEQSDNEQLADRAQPPVNNKNDID